MVHCTGCGTQVHESAPYCPRCGKPQLAAQRSQKAIETSSGSWAPVTSLVLGVLSALTTLDDSEWDKNIIVGLAMFSIAGLTIGVVGLNITKKWRGMSIAGIVLSAIGLLVSLSQ